MTSLAVIGGTGLDKIEGLDITDETQCDTPYGEPSAKLIHGSYAGREILFLPRHGVPPVHPPHAVNYRANLWTLKQHGVKTVIGANAVGGITREMTPRRLVIPDQIIDYTWGREQTICDGHSKELLHVEFSEPYCQELRTHIIDAAGEAGVDICPRGTYGATQGPRLETAAEIVRLERDGCDIVGMTGMPECSLARELDLEYASVCLVVNWAAGKSEAKITMELIRDNLGVAVKDLMLVFNKLFRKI